MSESGPVREWLFYVDDMIQFCDRVIAFTEGLDKAGFVRDRMRFDATLRNLELIGEAATHVPEPVRLSSPDIAWRKIIATRNRLIHAYLGIDNDTVWSIIESDVPGLRIALAELKGRSRP
jgi:uncharacterized protein with HEPN domain